MGDGIYDFTATDCQKNPSEKLIILCIADHASSDIFEEMIESSSFSMRLTTSPVLCFFFPKRSPK